MRRWHLGLVAAAMLGLAACELGQTSWAAPTPTQPGPVDPRRRQGVQHHAVRLKYRVLRKSRRSKPVKSDTVTVMYKGWLNDGHEFDSSYKTGKPLTFRLDQVIKGWGEGVQLIGEGGMIELGDSARAGLWPQGHARRDPAAGHAALHRRAGPDSLRRQLCANFHTNPKPPVLWRISASARETRRASLCALPVLPTVTPRPMRIAFVDFTPWDYTPLFARRGPLGGTQSAVCYLSRQLAADGCDVSLVNGWPLGRAGSPESRSCRSRRPRPPAC